MWRYRAPVCRKDTERFAIAALNATSARAFMQVHLIQGAGTHFPDDDAVVSDRHT
jgi:hypothetical protein